MTKKESRSKLISLLVGGIIFLVFIFPLYWMIATALRTQVGIFSILTPLWPENLTFEAFAEQLSAPGDMLRGFKNSLIMSCGTTAIATALTIPAAYDPTRFRFGARKGLVLFFLITQILSSTLALTSLYIIFFETRLLNTYWASILANAISRVSFSIIILRVHFASVPKELDEAAKIDGCGHVPAFTKITLPTAKSDTAATAVFSSVYARGNLICGATFITDPNMRPITSSIYNYIQQYQTLWNPTMAFGITTISPVVLIFIFMQKYIVGGLTNGTVKA